MLSSSELQSDPRYHAILGFVIEERIKLEIPDTAITPEPKTEGSCINAGEYYNLLYRQLLTTTEGAGGWQDLLNPVILQAAHEYVMQQHKQRAA